MLKQIVEHGNAIATVKAVAGEEAEREA